jgi:hypothetical protein
LTVAPPFEQDTYSMPSYPTFSESASSYDSSNPWIKDGALIIC